MKLFLGNKAYSSWSLRGWLAAKASGLPFEEVMVPLFQADWETRRDEAEFAASGGKVPILWDQDDSGQDVVVWDSLAIIDYLNDRTSGTRGYWPTDLPARGMARAIAAEMHSSFAALRTECTMNIRQLYPPAPVSEETAHDVARILQIWAEARARFGGEGEFLFGDWSAADMMYAPVVTRFATYAISVPPFAAAYMQAVILHPHMQEWIGAAQAEDWVIEKYERPAHD